MIYSPFLDGKSINAICNERVIIGSDQTKASTHIDDRIIKANRNSESDNNDKVGRAHV